MFISENAHPRFTSVLRSIASHALSANLLFQTHLYYQHSVYNAATAFCSLANPYLLRSSAGLLRMPYQRTFYSRLISFNISLTMPLLRYALQQKCSLTGVHYSRLISINTILFTCHFCVMLFSKNVPIDLYKYYQYLYL